MSVQLPIASGTNFYVFGMSPWANSPAYYTFNGLAGWWSVPLNWYCKTDANGGIITSPNQDFSNPSYTCTRADDGTLTYFDTARNYASGILEG